MKVLYAASEAIPLIASGGLADVAGALPKAIRNRRVACRVVLPLYQDIKEEHRSKFKYITNFYVDVSWRKQYCGVFEYNYNGVIHTPRLVWLLRRCRAFCLFLKGDS